MKKPPRQGADIPKNILNDPNASHCICNHVIVKISKVSSPWMQNSREKIAGSLNEFCNRWCKRENVECDALKDWKLNIFKIIDRRISFYSQNTNMLPRKPKISYRYLKSGIEEFHRKYVLVPADKAANNVVVVWRLHYIDTLKQELSGTKAYEQTSEKREVCHQKPCFP